MVLPDIKPVQQAIELVKKGKFLASRMNRFLSNINKIAITEKHLSGKYDLNTISDHQSRHPSECEADTCSIHKFIQELTDTVLDPTAKCASLQPNPGGSQASVPQVSVPARIEVLRDPKEEFTPPEKSTPPQPSLAAGQVHNTFFNRAAWLQAQSNSYSCRAAKIHLMSGENINFKGSRR